MGAKAESLGTGIGARVKAIAWHEVEEELDRQGCATIAGLLTPGECEALRALYARDELYRSRVVMARHGFGQGEYKYYAYPLPEGIGELRDRIYPHLAPVANRWNEIMGIDTRYPPRHNEIVAITQSLLSGDVALDLVTDNRPNRSVEPYTPEALKRLAEAVQLYHAENPR